MVPSPVPPEQDGFDGGVSRDRAADGGVSRDRAADGGVSRRGFLGGTAAVSAGVAVGALSGSSTAAASRVPDLAAAIALDGDPSAADVVLVVNGQRQRLRLDPRTTLLDALRDALGLTGTKKGCDHGACGSCTVHVAGRPALSCLTLAASVDGERITTIEGLADGDALHPMQQAFQDCDALQCGFCTPGTIMSAVTLARDGHDRSYDEIRDGLSGHICRCGAYANIVEAVRTARKRAG